MLVRLRNIRNNSIYIDNAFFATLNNFGLLGEIKLIVSAILHNLICSAESMYKKPLKTRIFSIVYEVEHF